MDLRPQQGLYVDGVEALNVINMRKLALDQPVRAAVRFPMELEIRLQTETAEFEARSVDVSANGVLFVGACLPDVDSKVHFTMTMPGEIMGHPNDLMIDCMGRIVRHERRPTGDLAAAVIDEYVLRT